MNFPGVITDVLSFELFNSLQDDLRFWELSNYSYTKDASQFLGRVGADELIFREAQTIVKYKIQKNFKHHLHSVRVHLNAAFPNTAGSVFHADSVDDDQITFVLYTNSNWNTQWGGETVISTPDGYKYVPYIPNTGCFFPSHWQHYGASPNAHAKIMRTSVAFTYKVCYNYPIPRTNYEQR